ncbi:(2Fe-2S)-binding protein [Rhodospirillum centenum]|uniref:Conserved domain protein n=1 Tax=Rhodospirillum centenum (strain ATCC 51521 / SW) TaxID=414684 RepID=B6IWW1_RHOCS|nr:(2Fe-2S)-binding protein [Rhodospirillum centenum]ACJ00785.1 conserved domain protein [Rhodospirillum centenum SW]
MYVCVCNAINCRTVKRCVDDGAASIGGVFKATGKTPQCGRCFSTMREMIAERIAPAPDALAVAAE